MHFAPVFALLVVLTSSIDVNEHAAFAAENSGSAGCLSPVKVEWRSIVENSQKDELIKMTENGHMKATAAATVEDVEGNGQAVKSVVECGVESGMPSMESNSVNGEICARKSEEVEIMQTNDDLHSEAAAQVKDCSGKATVEEVKERTEEGSVNDEKNQHNEESNEEVNEESVGWDGHSPMTILIPNPTLGFYHTLYTANIGNTLQEAGHNVIMLDIIVDSKFTPARRNKGITILTVPQNAITREIIHNGDTEEAGLRAFWEDVSGLNKALGFFSYYKRRGNFSLMMARQAEETLASDAFATLKGMKFDLLITEAFDLTGVALIHELRPARTILASSVPLHEWMGKKLGLRMSYDTPTKFSMSTPKEHRDSFEAFSSVGFIQNAMQSSIIGQEMFGYLEQMLTDIFLARDPSFPGFQTLLRSAHMLLENVHPLLDLSSNTMNWIRPIGGVTVGRRTKRTQKEDAVLNKILDDISAAKDKNMKAVLLSFGTVMDPKLMKPNTKENLVWAMGNVTEAVFLWKADCSELLPEGRSLPNNVNCYSWLPQNALLASGKIDVFVSHMGIGSFTEAAYAGVPLVSMPLFVDQHFNHACALRLGITKFVDKASLARTPDELIGAIRKALADKRMKLRSMQLKKAIESYGDQTTEMMKLINFTLSLPAHSPSLAFANHVDASLAKDILSIFYYVPENLVPLIKYFSIFAIFAFFVFPTIVLLLCCGIKNSPHLLVCVPRFYLSVFCFPFKMLFRFIIFLKDFRRRA